MLIQIKKSTVLCFKNYKFKCVIGKKGIKKNKIEGDKATPKGTYSLGKLYFRADRIKGIKTKLALKIIKKIWAGAIYQMTKNIIRKSK